MAGDAAVPLGYRVIAGLLFLVHRALRWRIDARGFEHVPATGGAVITWNHTSHLDVLATAEPLLRATGRWVRFLALRDLWEGPVLGRLLRMARALPVDRASADGRERALERAVTALRHGDLVVVAPEGRISTSGALLPFRTGAVRMAQAAGVPVVPTVSWGTHHLATTGRRPTLRRAWRLPVVVRVGAPLSVAPDEDPVAATARLRRATQGLLEDAQAAYPSSPPPDRH